MYVLAFILLIISLSKLLLLGSTTWTELKELCYDTHISIIQIAVLIILFDALVGAICGLYILI